MWIKEDLYLCVSKKRIFPFLLLFSFALDCKNTWYFQKFSSSQIKSYFSLFQKNRMSKARRSGAFFVYTKGITESNVDCA